MDPLSNALPLQSIPMESVLGEASNLVTLQDVVMGSIGWLFWGGEEEEEGGGAGLPPGLMPLAAMRVV